MLCFALFSGNKIVSIAQSRALHGTLCDAGCPGPNFWARGGSKGGEAMVNPFEDQDASFMALVNGAAEVSLWPAFLPAPEGWRVVAGPAPRAEILAFIEASGETTERHAA